MLSSTTRKLLKSVQEQMKELYTASGTHPWIIGFSGGKDSTLLLQLTIEMIQRLHGDERKRTIHVVVNDTGVESPTYEQYLSSTFDRVGSGLNSLGLPVTLTMTHPDVTQTFWVNLIGKGYPAPNRNFRWCTDRLKVRPTSTFIKEKVSSAGEVILLLGVRRDESATRAMTISKYDSQSDQNRLLHPHHKLKGCFVYRPLINVKTPQVWETLETVKPPWGGDHSELCTIYRDACAGDIAFNEDEIDSRSQQAARFGCWTCTVVHQDKSLESTVEHGHEELRPLLDYRKRIIEISENPEYRSKTRKNGLAGLGPITREGRFILLNELLELQDRVKFPVITQYEINLIKEEWAQEEQINISRQLRVWA